MYLPVNSINVHVSIGSFDFQFPQLKDLGRKYRQYHDAAKKDLEECKTENEELKKKLEASQVAFAEASSAPPPPPTEDLDKIKVSLDYQWP